MFILVVLILFLSSCNKLMLFIAKSTGEYTEPQKETPSSIGLYCGELQVNYDELFVIKSAQQYNEFTNKFPQIPGIYVFDKNKNELTSVANSNCPWTKINLLFDSTQHMNCIENTDQFDRILSSFTRVDSISSQDSIDYYMLCTWAKYMPKLTQSLFETIKKQKQQNRLNVCYILLNVDLQQNWDRD